MGRKIGKVLSECDAKCALDRLGPDLGVRPKIPEIAGECFKNLNISLLEFSNFRVFYPYLDKAALF
jgi:hypothetical protein